MYTCTYIHIEREREVLLRGVGTTTNDNSSDNVHVMEQ